MSPKTVLITGCSTGGTGAAMALAFHTAGYHVFASARDVSKMSSLASVATTSNRMQLLELDITDAQAIARTIDTVRTITQTPTSSNGTLNVLINNAGLAPVYPALDHDIAASKSLFEANFWGGIAMTQAFGEMVVAAKGTVVNICSFNAMLNPPWMGIYSASKAAQVSWSETLRREMVPFGVGVLTVITGAIDTPIMKKNKTASTSAYVLPSNSLYTPILNYIRGRAEGEEEGPRTASDVYANMIFKDVEKSARKGGSGGLVRRGFGAEAAAWLVCLLPPWVIDMMVTGGSGLKELTRIVAGGGSEGMSLGTKSKAA